MTSDATAVVDALRTSFRRGTTRALDWRRRQLAGIERFLDHEEPRILDALSQDLGKPAFEAWLTEIHAVRTESACARRHLARWARPRRVPTDLVNLPGVSHRVPEPLGVVLVIAPWNYPLYLSLVPTLSAIAAGNTVIIKPSEDAPAIAELLATTLGEYVSTDALRIVTGDADRVRSLLDEPLDHVFFTGSSRTAPSVAAAAARQLTPVTLELGGKNPCYVHASADLDSAARRIAWGKFVNAGQTCVAPDHLLIDREIEVDFVERLRRTIRRFYGEWPLHHPDYQRIVNRRHFERLCALLEDGELLLGGAVDASSLKIEPSVLGSPRPDAPSMRDEIFGPILPIVAVDGVDEAVARMSVGARPLAVYAFTRDGSVRKRIRDGSSSGGLCINDVVMQLAGTSLPFGGVGASGHGTYHGQAGFDTFSHLKSVLIKTAGFEIPVRYPPYSRWRHRLLRRFG